MCLEEGMKLILGVLKKVLIDSTGYCSELYRAGPY